MREPVSVRQAVAADIDRLAPLFDQYRQFHGQAGDVAAARTFLRARFDHGESIASLAAVEAYAKSLDARRITLFVAQPNTTARALARHGSGRGTTRSSCTNGTPECDWQRRRRGRVRSKVSLPVQEIVMHASTLTRSLMVSVALAFAGSAMAQATDKDRPAASKQSTAKPSAAKAAPAPKRLDFVPGSSVKETATRSSTPSRSEPAHGPKKQDSECGHQGMDA